MDGIRDSFSRMKKRIKHRLTGRKRKPDRTVVVGGGHHRGGNRVNVDGQIDQPGSLPRPEPHLVAGGSHDRGGDGTNTDGRQVYSTDRGKVEVDLGGREFSQRHSYLHSDVEAAMESGRSGEVERARPSPSTPPIPNSGKPDSMRTVLF